MKKILKANTYFLIILLLGIILPKYLVYIYGALGISDIRLILALNHMLLFIVPAIIYVVVTKANIKETFRLNKLYIKDILLIIVIGFIAYIFMACFAAISSMFFMNDVGNFITSISSTPYPILLLLIALMPAITEEITMRGIILSGYDGKSRIKASIVVGLLFGMIHMDLQQFLYTAVLGALLAYLVRVTNSIFSSVLVHFIVNGISITLSSFVMDTSEYTDAVSQRLDIINLSFDMKLSMIVVYIIMAIAIGGLIFKLIRILERLNIERNAEHLIKEKNIVTSEEKIINVPLILSIVIYIIVMAKVYFIR